MPFDRRQFVKCCMGALAFSIIAPSDAEAFRGRKFDYPEHEVREFLKMHFEGSRAFTARGLDKKERLFTRRFRQGLYKYFEKASKVSTTTPMVMDPFTGSQGATDYTVGDAKVRSEKAWVPVNFTDGRNKWTITYLMRNDQERNDDRWRIDDIQDVRGMLLSEVLKKLK